MKSEIREALGRAAREDFYSSLGNYFTWKDKRSPIQWAREERYIAEGQSPIAQDGNIRFKPEEIPWIIEPCEEAVSPEVQVTVLWLASGLGKTEGIAMTVMGHSICEEPGNIFSVMPKEESRDKFSRDVVERTIEATPSMRMRFVERKSRESGRTIGYKKFAGGSMFLTSAGSAANFRGPRSKVIHCGEIDGYPDDVDGEGDPVFLAFRRAEGFANSVKILEGTGTFAATYDANGKKVYNSRIHYWYEQGDQRKWFIPCRACGELQFTKFSQIWHPKGQPEKAVYLCGHCEKDHNDKQRLEAVRAGKWLPTAPFRGIRSYWMNAFSATFPAEKGFKSKLHQFVVDEERSHATVQARKVWVNTVAAELVAPEENGEAPPDWNVIYKRREDYATKERIIMPEGALVMTAGLDVHPDRIEINKGAYGFNEEFWHCENVIVPGDIRSRDVWKALEQELQRKYKHELGGQMGISFALVDAGHGAESVLWFLNYLRKTGSTFAGKLRACRGSSLFPHPVVDIRYMRISKQLHGHWVGGDEAKDNIYRCLRLEKEDGQPVPDGYRHYGTNTDEKFFEQLTAEQVTIVYKNGEELRRYKNEAKARNETLDTSVYGYAAFKLRKWNLEAKRKELEAATNPATIAAKKPEEKKGRIRRNPGALY